MNHEQVETVKHIVDGIAIAGVPMGIFGIVTLPDIYTALGCIWIAGRIYESGWFVSAWQRIASWISKRP